MIDTVCVICKEYVSEVWTIVIKDDKSTQEYSGHLHCVKGIQDQMNNIKNVDKKSVQQVLKELKLSH